MGQAIYSLMFPQTFRSNCFSTFHRDNAWTLVMLLGGGGMTALHMYFIGDISFGRWTLCQIFYSLSCVMDMKCLGQLYLQPLLCDLSDPKTTKSFTIPFLIWSSCKLRRRMVQIPPNKKNWHSFLSYWFAGLCSIYWEVTKGLKGLPSYFIRLNSQHYPSYLISSGKGKWKLDQT